MKRIWLFSCYAVVSFLCPKALCSQPTVKELAQLEANAFHFAKEPRIKVDSLESKIDDPITIQLVGLAPNQKVTLHARAVDEKGIQWHSSACFRSDPSGCVDISEQTPLYGSYVIRDGMGLFWSMQPSQETQDTYQAPDPQIIELSLEEENRIISTISLKRYKMSPNVVRKPLINEGLVGTYFYPKNQPRSAGIIILGGSHGGLNETTARVLASHGYATFALAYFGMKGLPDKLEQIPLEYFEKALQWFKSQPEVDENHIGLIGNSRGGELALVLASLFPTAFQAIAAYVPSHVMFAGLPNQDVPAWVYKGKPLAPPLKVQPPFHITGGKDRSSPVATAPLFYQLFQKQSAWASSEIPVENIQGALLLISGEDDKMWPSYFSSDYIKQKVKKHNANRICEHLHYPDAGHFISLPFLPTTCNQYFHPVAQLWMTVGGTAKDDAFAAKDSWQKVKDFFQAHLQKSHQ
jgi:dienelactone hydrolase